MPTVKAKVNWHITIRDSYIYKHEDLKQKSGNWLQYSDKQPTSLTYWHISWPSSDNSATLLGVDSRLIDPSRRMTRTVSLALWYLAPIRTSPYTYIHSYCKITINVFVTTIQFKGYNKDDVLHRCMQVFMVHTSNKKAIRCQLDMNSAKWKYKQQEAHNKTKINRY